MLANKVTISFIGSNENEFLSLIVCGVILNDIIAMINKIVFRINDA